MIELLWLKGWKHLSHPQEAKVRETQHCVLPPCSLQRFPLCRQVHSSVCKWALVQGPCGNLREEPVGFLRIDPSELEGRGRRCRAGEFGKGRTPWKMGEEKAQVKKDFNLSIARGLGPEW